MNGNWKTGTIIILFVIASLGWGFYGAEKISNGSCYQESAVNAMLKCDQELSFNDYALDACLAARWRMVDTANACVEDLNECQAKLGPTETFLNKFLDSQSICPPSLTPDEQALMYRSRFNQCLNDRSKQEITSHLDVNRIMLWERCSADDNCWNCISLTAKAQRFGNVEWCYENAR
jgi:hypothetical protein